jgi:phosphoribosylglycinamide formyltransferase 1
MSDLVNIGVLISGSGTNLQSILDACAGGKMKARVVCVISNKADAYGLERARKAGIPALHLDHRAHAGREAYDEALVATLREFGVQLVVMAGFMRIITSVLLEAFPMAVMNIHPALLSRSARAAPGARVRSEGGRVHRAFRRPRHRHRPDHHTGRGTSG